MNSLFKVRLVPVGSGPAVVRIAVKDESFLIGRDKNADLRLSSDAASRRHSLIVSRENEVVILDLGSFNGTVVNGEKLGLGETARLQHKDIVQFGTESFRMSVRDAETGAPVTYDEAEHRVVEEADGEMETTDTKAMLDDLERMIGSAPPIDGISALDAMEDELVVPGEVVLGAPKTVELDPGEANRILDDLLDENSDFE